MRAVIQRVLQSSVSVEGELVSSIGKGLFVLVGISRDDTDNDLEFIVRKILNVRFFEDENGKTWSKSVVDKSYEILCVSQFTLCHTLKGNKLDFHHAMKTEESKQFYAKFMSHLKKSYKSELVKNGVFGAYMKVDICNDGPVTIDIVSPREEKALATASHKNSELQSSDA